MPDHVSTFAIVKGEWLDDFSTVGGTLAQLGMSDISFYLDIIELFRTNRPQLSKTTS